MYYPVNDNVSNVVLDSDERVYYQVNDNVSDPAEESMCISHAMRSRELEKAGKRSKFKLIKLQNRQDHCYAVRDSPRTINFRYKKVWKSLKLPKKELKLSCKMLEDLRRK